MAAAKEKARAEAAEQGHLFSTWDSLGEEQRKELLQDTEAMDYEYISSVFKASIKAAGEASASASPPHDSQVLKLTDGDAKERAAWREHGLKLIGEGRVGILLLAGGQGTRLGSSKPKGCYDVGLPSHKSLFQLQSERLLRLQTLAATAVGSKATPKLLHWYIMTSPMTHSDTVAHFEEHQFFGLDRAQVHFFQQGFMPCLTEDGKLIMETPSRVAKAPDGNGGVYLALHSAGCLEHMREHGIECLDTFCVDNILARLGDPTFVGYCHSKGAVVGARVVAKAHPEEKVGVFALRPTAAQGAATNGHHTEKREGLCVVEYSELDPSKASAADPSTGRLYFNWSNICMHYFSTEWLRNVYQELRSGAAYHVARKKIPSKDGPVAGIKLELFIFDTFPTVNTAKMALVEVERAAEFAPVKNAPGTDTDSPDTARAAVLALHRRWVEVAGGKVAAPEGVEISPLVSYAGEGLESLSGKDVAGGQLTSLL